MASPRSNTLPLIIGGGLLTVFGVLFTLQGLDYVGGSAMSGVTLWAVLGPVIALIGIGCIVVGLRRRNRGTR